MSYLSVRNAPVGSLFDDLLNAGEDVAEGVVNDGRQRVSDEAGAIADQIIRSSQFKKVLDAVEGKASDAVKKEAGKNALALFGIAVSGGVVGGAFLKGKVGLGGAALLLAGSVGFMMWNARATTPPPARK